MGLSVGVRCIEATEEAAEDAVLSIGAAAAVAAVSCPNHELGRVPPECLNRDRVAGRLGHATSGWVTPRGVGSVPSTQASMPPQFSLRIPSGEWHTGNDQRNASAKQGQWAVASAPAGTTFGSGGQDLPVPDDGLTDSRHFVRSSQVGVLGMVHQHPVGQATLRQGPEWTTPCIVPTQKTLGARLRPTQKQARQVLRNGNAIKAVSPPPPNLEPGEAVKRRSVVGFDPRGTRRGTKSGRIAPTPYSHEASVLSPPGGH